MSLTHVLADEDDTGTGNGEALEGIFALREVSLRGFMVGFFHRYDLIFCSPTNNPPPYFLAFGFSWIIIPTRTTRSPSF